MKTIYLAGGCFWGLEKYVDQVNGVIGSEVGYANGRNQNATYGDSSGYAEAVKIDYDPEVAPLPFLLDLYYDAIDPTTVNRQGNDFGSEYRTGIYYTDPADKAVIEQSIAELQKKYSKPIAIEVKPLTTYSKAEEYHQKYLDKNPQRVLPHPEEAVRGGGQGAAEVRRLPRQGPTPLPSADYTRSNRSRFMTLSHAATKSCTNFSCASSEP